jgi:mannose-6-phosphate isomerase-like protein (cupin superfamily)
MSDERYILWPDKLGGQSNAWALPKDYSLVEIDFGRIGVRDNGFISVIESKGVLPFSIERVFWTYFTPGEIIRGQHAHYRTEEIIVAVTGEIKVSLEFPDGTTQSIILSKPNVGVYIPPYAWRRMEYSHNAVQLAIASLPYDASDYIRDKAAWHSIYGADLSTVEDEVGE